MRLLDETGEQLPSVPTPPVNPIVHEDFNKNWKECEERIKEIKKNYKEDSDVFEKENEHID